MQILNNSKIAATKTKSDRMDQEAETKIRCFGSDNRMQLGDGATKKENPRKYIHKLINLT